MISRSRHRRESDHAHPVACAGNIIVADDQGKILKSDNVSQLIGGRSVSLDLNADTDLPGVARTQIHGLSVAPNGCRLLATVELIDNSTQKTVLVVGSEQTYPLTPLTPIISRQTNGAQPDTSTSQPR